MKRIKTIKKGVLLKSVVILTVILPGIIIATGAFRNQVDSEPEAKQPSGEVIDGDISFYANELAGEKTASGDVYDPNMLTAAHRNLPMGTKVQVENLENNKKVTVEINDRGPYADGRKLDVSKKAAKQLGFVKDGETRAEITILDNPDNK